MRRLEFESIVDFQLERTWKLFTEVENYPDYIKFCNRAIPEGSFEEGNYWYDWTTILYLPLKIRHKIVKISLQKELLYLIEVPFIIIEQKITFEDLRPQTRVKIELTFNFGNKLLEKVFGPLLFRRNTEMIEDLMNSYKRVKSNEAS